MCGVVRRSLGRWDLKDENERTWEKDGSGAESQWPPKWKRGAHFAGTEAHRRKGMLETEMANMDSVWLPALTDLPL